MVSSSSAKINLFKYHAAPHFCDGFFLFFLCFAISEPNFVFMDIVGESLDSPDGDDDKVYFIFSENAVEYDFYTKVKVSRVARVCKVWLKVTDLNPCMCVNQRVFWV